VVFGYTPGDEAFRWSSFEMQALGDLPGGSSDSRALAASFDGNVIVGFGDGNSASQRAAIWIAGSGVRDLGDYLLGRGAVGLTGWRLNEATGISADGLTIAGNGINPDGFQEAWIATIPEPSTWTLAVFGAAGLAYSLLRRRATHR
jgi:uncharacterized membrane protein